MKYPVTVQAVCLSKLGEFIADEREIASEPELEDYRQNFARYTVRFKSRRRRRLRFSSLLRRFWWTIPVLLVTIAIVAKGLNFKI